MCGVITVALKVGLYNGKNRTSFMDTEAGIPLAGSSGNNIPPFLCELMLSGKTVD